MVKKTLGKKRKRNSGTLLDTVFPVDSSEEKSVSSNFEEDDEELEDSEGSDTDSSDSSSMIRSWGRGAGRKRKKIVACKGTKRSHLELLQGDEASQMEGEEGRAEGLVLSSNSASGPLSKGTLGPSALPSERVSHASLFSSFLPPRFVGISRAGFSGRRKPMVSSNPTVQEVEMQRLLNVIQSHFTAITPTFDWDSTFESMRFWEMLNE